MQGFRQVRRQRPRRVSQQNHAATQFRRHGQGQLEKIIFARGHNSGGKAPALRAFGQSPAGGFQHVGLGGHAGRGAARMDPPMVKNARNMGDFFWPELFGHAQAQIKILRTFQAGAQAADFAQCLDGIGREMAGAMQVEIKCRLEHRRASHAVDIDLVLIAVQQAQARTFRRVAGHFQQSVRNQQIVVIQKGRPRRVRQSQGAVARPRDMSVPFPENQPDALVPRGIGTQQFRHFRSGGGVVGQAELPVPVALAQYGIQGRAQKRGLGIPDRHEHGDFRPGAFHAQILYA